MQALSDRGGSLSESKGSLFPDERVWYDQFTSTDWVHDTIADSHRVKALRSRKDFWGRILVALDGSQGWILSALCGFVIALIAYTVDVAESTVFDYKDGFCARAWYLDEKVRNKFGTSMSCYEITDLGLEMLPSWILRRLEKLVQCVEQQAIWPEMDRLQHIPHLRALSLCSFLLDCSVDQNCCTVGVPTDNAGRKSWCRATPSAVQRHSHRRQCEPASEHPSNS